MSGKALPVVSFTNLAGGLNKLVSQTRVKDNESPNLQNVEFVEDGLPSKRRGFTTVGDTSAGAIKGDGSLYLASGTRIHLRVKNTTLQKLVGSVWTDITGATFSGSNVNFVQAKNAIYIFDGGTIKKYDGTTLSVVTSSPKALYGIFYSGMVVSTGDADNPSRVNLSAPSSPDSYGGAEGTATSGSTTTIVDSGKTWTTDQWQNFTVLITGGVNTGQSRVIQSNTGTTLTLSSAYGTAIDSTSKYTISGGNSIDISKDDGQKMMGLGKFEEKLLAFKERSTYQITFDISGYPTVQQISNSVGTVSHRTIESVENDVIYLANDGLRTFGYVPNIPNVIRTNILSKKVGPNIQNINWVYAEQACAIYHDNKYILSVPYGSSTINNTCEVFQLLYGCWTHWNGFNANCFNQFIDTDKVVKLYFGDELYANTYELLVNAYNDNGVAIDAHYFTKQDDFGHFSTYKKISFIDVQTRSLTGTLNVDVIADGTSTAKSAPISSTFSAKDGLRVFMFREAMLRQDAGSTASVVGTDDVRRIKFVRKVRTSQLKFWNKTVNENFTLMSYAYGVRNKSPKSFDASKTIY